MDGEEHAQTAPRPRARPSGQRASVQLRSSASLGHARLLAPPLAPPTPPARTLIGQQRAIKARARGSLSPVPGRVEDRPARLRHVKPRRAEDPSAACPPPPSSCAFSVIPDDVDVDREGDRSLRPEGSLQAPGRPPLLLLPHWLGVSRSALRPGPGLTWGALRTDLPSVHGAGSRGCPLQGLTAHACTWLPRRNQKSGRSSGLN